MNSLERAVSELLRRSDGGEVPLQGALEVVITAAAGQGGTLHILGADSVLQLAAWTRNIPPPVLEAVRQVPIGKGMAGIAAERRAPVTTCDLQSDNAGGVARPGAKATGFRGSICVPMIDGTGELRGTLGIGCAETREFVPAEVDDLLAAARTLADAIGQARGV